MAGDTFNWEVILRLATQGAKGSEQDIKRVQGAVDELYRSEKLSDKETANLTRGLNRLGNEGATAGKKLQQGLTSPSLRYALYDVSQTAGLAAVAIAGVGTAALVAGAQYERAFADVERTLQPGSYGVEQLRGELTQLSRELPLAFGEITQVATLGNQLGIAGSQVEGFTETVAQFSAVTGVSINESALAFGQLDNLLPDVNGQFDRLGSSIALVGVNSAATESQIIAVAREIAPAAASAGFAANEVVGLSGALASLKVPPERSRSTILQFFETLNNAVANGGEDLQNFASVVGVSATELDRMVRSGQGRSILERFIGNVSTSDSVAITQALQNLGLAGLRTNPTIRALAGNMELLNSTFADGERGWQQNTELARQYGIILETLSERWRIFLNAFMEFGATIGTAILPAAKAFLDVATEILNSLSDFAKTPFGEAMLRTVVTITALTAGLLGLGGAVAGSFAALVALRFAVTQIGWAGATSGLKGFVAGLVGLRGGATGAATGVATLTRNFRIFARSTVIIGVIQLIAQAFMDLGGTVDQVGNTISEFGTFLRSLNWGGAFNIGAEQIRDFGNSISVWSKTMPRAESEIENIGAAAGALQASLSGGYVDDFGSSLADMGDDAAQAATEVRTLVNYADDLASVWTRAFDIRFGGQSSFDQITKTFLDMARAMEEAAAKSRSLRADIGSLQSDINTQRYFLSIALEYGDTARAEAIRADLAKTEAELADKTAELNKVQEENNKTLVGNSSAAITNRATILGLVQQYQSHIQALASSGLSTDQLKARTDQLRQDFMAQATQLGYNQTELGEYALAFGDVKTAIDNVPRDINVNFNADPALQALNEFAARAAAQATQAGQAYGDNFGAGLNQAMNSAAQEALLQGVQITNDVLNMFRTPPGGRARRGGGSFATGGFTGRGGKYEPAGVVHRGEYVVPKHQVNQRTGLPYADALGKLQRGTRGRTGYAGGGYVAPPGNNGGGHIASFGPMAQMQLQQALQQIITMDSGVIAGTVGTANARSTARGNG